jgi:hypothetical protein
LVGSVAASRYTLTVGGMGAVGIGVKGGFGFGGVVAAL